MGRVDVALLIGSALLLLIGLFTPVSSALLAACTLGGVSSWLLLPHQDLFDHRMISAHIFVVAVAIAMIGPGAFSCDAYLYGRREIVFPPSSNSPNR